MTKDDLSGGALLRQRIADQYEHTGYTPDGREEELIDRACTTADVIAALELVVQRDGPTTADGKIAPAVVELRQQHAILLRLLGALDFGTEDGEQRADLATQRARRSANARWAGHPLRSTR
jgi:hypothetical protein